MLLRTVSLFTLAFLVLALSGPGQWLHEETHHQTPDQIHTHAHHSHKPHVDSCDTPARSSKPTSSTPDENPKNDCHTCHLLARHLAAGDFHLPASTWSDLSLLERCAWPVVLSSADSFRPRVGARDPPFSL